MKNNINIYYFRFQDVTENIFDTCKVKHIKKLKSEAEHYRLIPDQNRYIAGRLLLLKALSIKRNNSINLNHLKFTQYKKPFFNAPFHFNISHSGEYVIVAVSELHELGCDIEYRNPDFNINEFSSFFTEKEILTMSKSPCPYLELFDLWTIKESILKADGRGMHFPPKSISFRDNIALVESKVIYYSHIEIDEQYSSSVASLEIIDDIEIAEIKEFS